jgi:branched-chain amino acid transport system substrate-binding protein
MSTDDIYTQAIKETKMMKLRRLGIVAAGAAALMSIALWPAPVAAQTNELVFGALLPLTGPAARIGLEQQNGIEFATARINAAGGVRGYKIRFVYEDTQGKPDQGVLAFNRVVDLHKVPALLTAYSSVSLAIAPLATRKKVLVINPAAQTNKLADASPYLVNTIPLVKDEVGVIAKYYENAAVGIDIRDEFTKAFTAMGGTIVADEAIEFGSTNVRPSLLKIAAAKPDFVFTGVTSGPGVVTEQIASVPGFPISVGTSFFTSMVGQPVAAGWYHSAVKSSVVPETEKEFNAKFNTKEMGFFAREYADAVHILSKLIDQSLQKGRPITGEALKTTLFELKTFETASGKLSFDGNTAKRDIEIYKLTPPGRTLVQTSLR